MTLTGFIKYAIIRCKPINFGNSIKDKLRLLTIAVLESIPGHLQQFFGLDSGIQHIIETYWRCVVVKSNGVIYALVDRESFDIVNEFESFMVPWFNPASEEVVVDVGAHIGKYTIKTAQLVGDNGAVLAIEANPVNYRVLKRNIKLNNTCNVTALNVAAWNTDSKLKLFVGNVGGHHSTKINWNLGWYSVRARAIDEVIKEFKIDKVDWIKIDVEGAEWEVLSGLKNTIVKHKPKVIVELSYDNIIKVKNFVKDHGYDMVKISSTFEGVIYGISRKFTYFLLLPIWS